MISGTLYGIGIGPGDPEMVAATDLTRGYFFSNHASNYLPVKAKLPGSKQKALDLIDAALRGRGRPETQVGAGVLMVLPSEGVTGTHGG